MKRNLVLTTTSLLSIILLSLHLTDDIVYGADKSAILNVIAVAILVVWLYGTLALAQRRSGYAIIFLGSVVGMAVFTIHVSHAGGLSAGSLAASSGAFFFAWTLLALAVTSVFSAILSASGFWDLRRWKAPSDASTSS
jgi:hypothetical protein